MRASRINLTARGYEVDLAARQVHTTSGSVRLTPTEWHLLEVLVRHEGKIVTQRHLLTEVWGPSYVAQTNYGHCMATSGSCCRRWPWWWA